MSDSDPPDGTMDLPLGPRLKPETESGSTSTQPSETVRLKRQLSLFNGCTMVIGVIVGSGIFVSPKGVLIMTGSVGGALVVWSLGGIICLIGALCFAELGCLITESGGMYAYIKEVFGSFPGFAFLWTAMLIIFPAANAVIALACGYYILQPIFPCGGAPYMAVRIIAALTIAFLTFINCQSVRVAKRIQDVFTIIKCLALAMIILTGLVALGQGRIDNFQNMFAGSSANPSNIALAFYSGLFSYSGWYTLNFLTEELKNPYKNLPRAIYISMPLVTLIYVLSNVAYFAVLSIPEIIESDAVAVTFADQMFGLMSWTMPVFVAFSTFGSLNGCIMSVSRMFFVGARDGHLPDVLALISVTKFTPMPAVMFEGIASIILLAVPDIFMLINCVSFVEALSFLVCTVALLYLRYKKPDAKRPIKVPLVLPITFLIVCIFLVIFPLYSSPVDTGIGLAILASSLPAYCIGVVWKRKPKVYRNFIRKFTIMSQKILTSVPQDDGKEE